MGLETPTYISDLNPAWPLGTDRRREGDDHIRNVKAALKNTFPNMNSQVTATPAQLNGLPNNFAALLAELVENLLPYGTIVMWSGTLATIPAGWALCDGQNGTPDLRGYFVLGPNTDVGLVPGVVGGGQLTGAAGSHNHDVSETALTVAQMPVHSHPMYIVQAGAGGSAYIAWQLNHAGTGSYNTQNPYSTINEQFLGNIGNGEAHTHSTSIQGEHIHQQVYPPFVVLAYIMKITTFTMPP